MDDAQKIAGKFLAILNDRKVNDASIPLIAQWIVLNSDQVGMGLWNVLSEAVTRQQELYRK